MKSVREPDAGNPHVRFDERRGGNGRETRIEAPTQVGNGYSPLLRTAPPADSTRHYHDSRTHLGLSKDAPASRPVQNEDRGADIIEIAEVFGLHHRYERRAA